MENVNLVIIVVRHCLAFVLPLVHAGQGVVDADRAVLVRLFVIHPKVKGHRRVGLQRPQSVVDQTSILVSTQFNYQSKFFFAFDTVAVKTRFAFACRLQLSLVVRLQLAIGIFIAFVAFTFQQIP